jgi:hypothetical protein
MPERTLKMTADLGKAADGLWRAGEDGAWPDGEFEKGRADKCARRPLMKL